MEAVAFAVIFKVSCKTILFENLFLQELFIHRVFGSYIWKQSAWHGMLSTINAKGAYLLL